MQHLLRNKASYFLIILVLFTAVETFAQAVALPKIGVVDVNRVYRETNRNSSGMKQIEDTKNRVNEEVKKRQDDIQALEEKRLDAVNSEDTKTATDLSRQITTKKAELERYWNTADSQLKRMADSIKVDPDFMEVIHKAIISVSDRGGYSVVMASNANMLYWSKKVDISAEVIAFINSNP